MQQVMEKTARVESLKSKLILKDHRSVRRGLAKEGATEAYRPGVKLCLERAKLWTESYKLTEGEPYILRRAKALANVLENMAIYIQDGEVLVGNYASSPAYINFYPEYSIRWLLKAINEEYKHILDVEGKEELKHLGDYWRAKAVQGLERRYLSPELMKFWRYNGATFWYHGVESGVPDYEKLFKVGLKGLVGEAEKKLRSLEDKEGLSALEYVEQKEFLEAVLISLEAVIRWGERYAELAAELAKNAEGQRRQELEWISHVCHWVPANPPRTLYEALQFFLFIHLITHVIDCHENGIGVRFDQVFNSFYVNDREAGIIDRKGAKELFQLLWIKLSDMAYLVPPVSGAAINMGSALQQTLTLGGVTRDGDDASNELTYLILDSCDELGSLEPTTAVRVHKATPDRLLFRVVDSLLKRSGTVSFFNDEVVIPRLTKWGIPLKDARNYGIEQCMRWTIPGKNFTYRAFDGFIMLPKCLELALNRGVDKMNGEQLGAVTPDPLTFKSIDEVIDATVQQVGYCAERLAKIGGIVDTLYQRYLPRPFLSALYDGGIEAGKSCREWWSYFPRNMFGFLGGINAANALSAMGKLVFEDKQVSMEELLDAISCDWQGKEELRQIFINKAPKFGNGDDYVDSVAAEFHSRITKEVENIRNSFGHHYIVDGSSGSAYFAFSGLCGATPDGRKSGDLFADGTASPVIGTDKTAPTAVLRSVSKLDVLQSFNHLLNQNFLPQSVSDNREAFVAYLKTWRDLGVHHIQFNILAPETLVEAQKQPEKYSNLVVRVAGYAGIFVDLSKDVQDEIIRRTMQRMA